jgi:hypothetical protein
MLSEATIYSLSIAGLGFFGLVVRYCFKSKCSEVSCCFGLFKIERDIEQEIEQQHIENNLKSRKNNSNVELNSEEQV